jgi:hypothetical protein
MPILEVAQTLKKKAFAPLFDLMQKSLVQHDKLQQLVSSRD